MKLGTKLIIYLVAIVIITMTIHGYLSIRQDRKNFSREIQLGMRGFTRSIQAALGTMYGDNRDLKATQEFIDKVGNRGNIHGLIVYNTSGEPVAVSDSLRDTQDFPELNPTPMLQMDPRPVLASGKGVDGYLRGPRQLIYYRLEPILNKNNQIVGAFAFGRQGQSLFRTVEARRNRVIITTFILILVLGALILLVVRYNVSIPIQQLMARTAEIAEGRWTRRMEVSGSDEITSLAREFNRMSERLQDTYARLVREQQEKLRLERDLRHSEKLASVGQLAAGLAHEIGTPLNIIAGRAEYLLRRPRRAEEATENLHIIRSQIDRIAGIVQRLLKFARRNEPAFRAVNISALLSNVQRLLQHESEEKAVQVELALADSMPVIQADPDLLQQVFFNLYQNSLQAMDQGGTIKIRAEVDGEDDPAAVKASGAHLLRITFEDTGRGIPAEHIERVFDPFFTTKDIGQGTGLGLSVAYGIVKDHGGEIRVESEPGRFTRFVIRLPIGCSRGESERTGLER